MDVDGNREKDIETIKEIAKATAFADLATCEADQPRVRPVSAFIQDDLMVLVPTFLGSRKVAQVKANPRVEICFVDERHRQVRVEGQVEFVDDVAAKDTLMKTTLTPEMWAQYFKGPDDPNFALLRIVPTRYEWNESGQVAYKTLIP